jgi:hypothetical protein
VKRFVVRADEKLSAFVELELPVKTPLGKFPFLVDPPGFSR